NNPGNPNPPLPVDLVLRGTSRGNRLTGGDGNDMLYGKSGKDVLTGGAGQDRFVFDTKPKKSNLDTIRDFDVRQDSLYLDNKIFKKLGKGSLSKPGKLKSSYFKTGNEAKDGKDYLIYNRSKGVLYYDQDGSGSKAMVEILKLSNKARITKSDIFII
ncbi:hypothetical protein ACFOYU_16265, partial [Microvirga sp. GCM10011540]